MTSELVTEGDDRNLSLSERASLAEIIDGFKQAARGPLPKKVAVTLFGGSLETLSKDATLVKPSAVQIGLIQEIVKNAIEDIRNGLRDENRELIVGLYRVFGEQVLPILKQAIAEQARKVEDELEKRLFIVNWMTLIATIPTPSQPTLNGLKKITAMVSNSRSELRAALVESFESSVEIQQSIQLIESLDTTTDKLFDSIIEDGSHLTRVYDQHDYLVAKNTVLNDIERITTTSIFDKFPILKQCIYRVKECLDDANESDIPNLVAALKTLGSEIKEVLNILRKDLATDQKNQLGDFLKPKNSLSVVVPIKKI